MADRIEAASAGAWIPVLETRGATGRASCIRIAPATAVDDDEIHLSRFINGEQVQVSPDSQLDADLDFIASARQDMPRLIAEVRRLRGLLKGDSDPRHAAFVALRELGRSQDYRDRADAGRGLAAFADMPEAHGPLLELVLDPGDTFVTRVTAEAVLRRKDRIGLTVVASAMAVANPNHSDWIHTAIVDVFSIFSADRDRAMQLCEEILRDTDDRVAPGARQLHDVLAEIDPVLRPA
ncbi:hypothetical protein KCH_03730 [Kitasatospora cheerisanensis KCTC 2395]|uniref:Uncharacterized protein n=2 Tax=Kitasatospora cheerisanensis TaxID=81942 RepID=A0A066ZBP9_9ACTN|nr:hypothetical protein KCH_03730 [Kitasatospora cheerisanensis KCTC 2395]